ncbi:hypothetical protein BGW41_007283 [Actinomortierella wolfii]|nr:hypothetical protein BGW41_007283 [Actinomortierella wolfii]
METSHHSPKKRRASTQDARDTVKTTKRHAGHETPQSTFTTHEAIQVNSQHNPNAAASQDTVSKASQPTASTQATATPEPTTHRAEEAAAAGSLDQTHRISQTSETISPSGSRSTPPPPTTGQDDSPPADPESTENTSSHSHNATSNAKKRRPFKPRGPYRARLRRPQERTDIMLEHMIRSRISTLPTPANDLTGKSSDRIELDSMRHYPYDYPYLQNDFPYEDRDMRGKRLQARENAIRLKDDSWYVPQGAVAAEDLFSRKKLKYSLSILEAFSAHHAKMGNRPSTDFKFDSVEYYSRGFALAARKVLDKIKKEEINKMLRVSDEAVSKLYNGENHSFDLGIDPSLRRAIAEMTQPTPSTADHEDILALLANLPEESMNDMPESTNPVEVSGSEDEDDNPPEPKDSNLQAMSGVEGNKEEGSGNSSRTPRPTLVQPPPPVDTTKDIPAKEFGSIPTISDALCNLVEAADEVSSAAVKQAIQDNTIGRQHLSEASASTPVDLADYYQANLFLSAVFAQTKNKKNIEPIVLSHGACRIIQTLLSGLEHKLVSMGCHLQRAELTRLLASANYDMIHPSSTTNRSSTSRGRRKSTNEEGPSSSSPSTQGKGRKKPPKSLLEIATNPLGMQQDIDPFAKARRHVIQEAGAWREAQRQVAAQKLDVQHALEEERTTLLAREEEQINQLMLRKKIGDAGLPEVANSSGGT